MAYFTILRDPILGHKGSGLFGNAISTASPQVSPLAYSVKYRGGLDPAFLWWLEDFIDPYGRRIAGAEFEQGLGDVEGFGSPSDTGHVNVLGFAGFLHGNQLKVQLLHFRGNTSGRGDDPVRDEYTYRSGIYLMEG